MPTDTPSPNAVRILSLPCGHAQIQNNQPRVTPLTPLKQNRRDNDYRQAQRVFEAAVLAYHNHEIERVNAALHDAGIDWPQGARGVADLAAQRDTRGQALIEKIEELAEEWKASVVPNLKMVVERIIALIREDDERYD